MQEGRILRCAEGFNRGWKQLRQVDVEEARVRLWDAIGCKNRVTFGQYKSGKTVPSVVQAARIEEVFNSFGIFREIWGQ